MKIATGEESYRVSGTPHAFYNDGSKGIDYDANTACPNISFATVHICEFSCKAAKSTCQSKHLVSRPPLDAQGVGACADPGSWGIEARKAAAFANQFIADRAAVAHALGKPYILEETGKDVRGPALMSLLWQRSVKSCSKFCAGLSMACACAPQSTYDIFYVDFLLAMFAAAEATDAAAIMPWELVPFHTTAGNYDFGIDDATFGAVAQMVEYQLTRVRPTMSWPHAGPPPPGQWLHVLLTGAVLVLTDGGLQQRRLPGAHASLHLLRHPARRQLDLRQAGEASRHEASAPACKSLASEDGFC